MSYSVDFTPEAQDDLQRLPPRIGNLALDHVERLATQPVALSEPGGSAHEGTQTYPFWGSDGKEQWRLILVFRYSVDETSIIIDAIDAERI